MVSERDRRALEEIERQTAGQDPRFAASMRRARRNRTDPWIRHGYDLVVVLGTATAVLCFVLLLICAAVVAVLLVAVTWYLRAEHVKYRNQVDSQLSY